MNRQTIGKAPLPSPGIRFMTIPEGMVRMTSVIRGTTTFHGIEFFNCDLTYSLEDPSSPVSEKIERLNILSNISRYLLKM